MKKVLLIFILTWCFCTGLKDQSIYCGPFTPSAKLNLNNVHGHVIEYKSFNNITDFQIHLTDCSDITIRYCRFKGSRAKAVRLDNCVRVTVEYDYFEDCYGAFYATNCTGGNIHFDWNEGKNITGDASHINSFWQLNSCSGPNITSNYNKLEIAFGPGANPNPGVGDLFNMYNSNGTSTSPIQVWHNEAIGGGTNVGSLGFAGILAGDLGGSWQDIRYNTLINTGYVGIQQVGGTHITITLNKIVGTYNVWSRAGITSSNAQPTPATNNEVSHNEIYWIAGYSGVGVIPMPGAHVDTVYKPANNVKPTGWSTNIVYPASVSHFPTPAINVLPHPLVTPCALPIFTYAPLTNTWAYGDAISLTPLSTGGAITGYTVSPTLPTGISLNTTTGIISGSPSHPVSSAPYTVIGINSDGADTAVLTLQVNKRPLSITADNKIRPVNTANPTFTATYDGFAFSDGPGSLTTGPTISTTAVLHSPAGLYPITASGAVSANYSFTYHPGVLTITGGGGHGGIIIHRRVKYSH